MATRITDGIDRFRQPEFTGENRCTPCTVVNLLVGLALANLVVLVGVWIDAPVAGALGGGAVFLVSVVAIYLRGYLVPGTPQITKTYFPDSLLSHFGKHPASPDDGADVERTLLRAGAVTECDDVDDLCLADGFRPAWRERIAELREADASRAKLATMLDVESGRIEMEAHAGSFVARIDGRRVGQWASREAFVADVAADRELGARSAGWTDLDARQRSAALSGLRIFLERCPGCDAPVSVDETVVESCCRSIDVVAVTCDGCDARLFEAEAPAEAA